MAPKSSTLTQRTLSFGTSKRTAPANAAKKAAAISTNVSAPSTNAENSPIEVTSGVNTPGDTVSEINSGTGPSDTETEDPIEDVKPNMEEVVEEVVDGEASARPSISTTKATVKAKPVAAKNVEASVAEAPISDAQPIAKKKVEIDPELAPRLNVKNKAYSKLLQETREKNSYLPPVHAEDQKFDRVQEILRTFDLEYKYGPCIGMTRLERWKRAKALKLNPPQEIYDILTTKEGLTNTKYSADVLTGRV